MYIVKKVIISSLFCIGFLFSNVHAEEGYEFFVESELEMFKVVFPGEPQDVFPAKDPQEKFSQFEYVREEEKVWSLGFTANRRSREKLAITVERGLYWKGYPRDEPEDPSDIFPYHEPEMSQTEIAKHLEQVLRTSHYTPEAQICTYLLQKRDQNLTAIVVEGQLEDYEAQEDPEVPEIFVIVSWLITPKNIYEFTTEDVSLEEHRKFVASFEYTDRE